MQEATCWHATVHGNTPKPPASTQNSAQTGHAVHFELVPPCECITDHTCKLQTQDGLATIGPLP
jgi:hypothetical protein